MRRHLVTAALWVSVVMLAGCGMIKKKKECGAFVEKVNAAVSEIEVASKATDGKNAVASMKKLGDLYDQLSKDIGAIGVTTDDLKKQTTEYQEMCTKAAKAARQVAEAIETSDPAKAESAQKEFDGIVKQEETLVSKINTYCQAP